MSLSFKSHSTGDPHLRLGALASGALTFLVLNAVWESAQLPLYTLWYDGTPTEILYALVHCTFGDLLIGIVAALAAVAILRLSGRPSGLHSYRFLMAILAIGLTYTVFSEWLNVSVRRSWAYTEWMPVVPPMETGLTPLLQWLVVPVLTWWITIARSGSPNG